MDMPVPMQLKLFGDLSCRRQLMEAPYANTCLPTFGSLDISAYDDSSDNSYKNNDIITVYSNSNCGNSNILNIGCEDVGLGDMRQNCVRCDGIISSPGTQLDQIRREAADKKLDPYSPLCMVPLPGHLIEPNFVRRRNERERERVRCVNEGYDKLKEHLPIENKDRRISKVETLRRAIDYIRELQSLLDQTDGNFKNSSNGGLDDSRLVSKRRKTRFTSTTNDTQAPFPDL